jgi:polyisoprenyl-phosphate glycosyltransferase
LKITASPFVSVVIPVHNEETNVSRVHEEVTQALATAGVVRHELIFVDDGSHDATLERIVELNKTDPCVKALSFSRNFGHQAALTAGLEHARGDVVLTMDGDLEHPPKEIPRFLDKWREGYEIVQGVRSTGSARSGVLKAMGTWIFYRGFSFLADVDIDAWGADYRLLDRKAVSALTSIGERTRFLRGLVKWIGFRHTTLTFDPATRTSGESSFGLRRLAQLASAGVLSFSIVPLRLASCAGALLAVLAMVFGLYAVSMYFQRGTVIEGWTSTMVVVVGIGSMQLISLGIFGEYLATLIFEMKARPIYIVRERLGIEDEGETP